MIDIVRILFYGSARFHHGVHHGNESDVEKGLFKMRPASPGPPVVPRPSGEGCKPIARRFQELIIPENERILKAMGGKIHGLAVSGRPDGFLRESACMK